MSINEATPQDWNRVRQQHPAIEKTGLEKTGLETWMQEAHETEFVDPYDIQYDPVGKPKHYNSGNIECIEAIEESMSSHAFKGYLKGNCIKYLWRYDYKGKQVEDLQKAGWYLNRLTKIVTEENE